MKETKTLEFKSAITNTFLKTVSAYANFGTGVIEFGRNDDGSICGLSEPEQACLDIENRINDSISPKPEFALRVNKKNRLVELTVFEGENKPYLYKGKAYRRSDTASVEVDSIELKRLTLEGMNISYEELPCKDENLTFDFFERTLIQKMEITELTDDMLRTFGFYTSKKEMNNAAALFADMNQMAGVDLVRFGKNISEILDRETIQGCCILRQFDQAMAMYRRYYQYEKIEGKERQTVELIPETAFREAIANALVHRTWDVNAHIRVSMTDEGIEVTLPGGLPKGISEEEYLAGKISSLRNPIIGTVFFRLHYIEMFGTGIARIKDAYTSYAQKPTFECMENSVSIKLPVVTESLKVSADGDKILSVLKSGIQLSSTEIAERLGWNKAKAIREINLLKDKGYLVIIGSGRGTKYAKQS